MGDIGDPFVNIMPWAGLQQEVKIGNTRFWPWEQAEARVADSDTKDTVQRYVNCFVDHHGEPVKTVTVCSYDGKEFQCPTDSEWSEMRYARDALVFSVICPEVVRSIRGCSIGLCSAERFQVVGQQLKRGEATLYVLSGYNTTFGRFNVHRPLAVSEGYVAQPQPTLVSAFDKVFADAFPAALRTKLFRSLEWFRLAHVEADQVSELSRIVMMATAFETLFGISKQVKDKSMFFATQVEKRLRIQESLCTTRTHRQKDHTYTKAAWWAYDFYKLRNKIVHGDDLQSHEALFNLHVRQKDVADAVFYQILFRILCEEACISYPSSMSGLDSEELWDRLFADEDFRQTQEVLGWINTKQK